MWAVSRERAAWTAGYVLDVVDRVEKNMGQPESDLTSLLIVIPWNRLDADLIWTVTHPRGTHVDPHFHVK